MVLFFIFIIFFITFLFSDFVPIIKKKEWKILWVYSILMITAFTVNTLVLMKVKLPVISVSIKDLFSIFFKPE